MRGLAEFYAASSARHPRATAIAVAAVSAGTLSTVVQIALWVLFTDAWPDILHRDARLAAALVMGRAVLPPPVSFDPVVTVVATIVHFALSVVYCGVVAWLVGGRPLRPAVALGAVFGIALYAVNMYGFTALFPWFAQARDWITATAHIAFGMIAAATLHATRSRVA